MGSTHPAPVIFQLKNRRPGKWQDRKDIKVEQHHNHRHHLELPGSSSQELLVMVRERPESGVQLLPPPAHNSTSGSQKRGHAS